jgi:hypothetical protein
MEPLYQYNEVAQARALLSLYTLYITRYVQINFVAIVNQTWAYHYLYCTDNETLVQ